MKSGGNGHHNSLHFRHPPKRVVSLVPSMTESMFDLGLGSSVVGITDYCVHPADSVMTLPHLGGPKNPCIGDILALEPDLVLANWEENTLHTVEELEAAGIAVWVSFPKTVRQSLDVLWTLVGLFRNRSSAARLETLELTLDWAISSASEKRSFRCFCPIWYDQTQAGIQWWMTFNQDTYCHDLLQLLGYHNAFADRQRQYPLEADLGSASPEETQNRDTRYPRLTLADVQAAEPEVILLPSEPFIFTETHIEQLTEWLQDTPAVQRNCVFLVEGSLITWHGTRLARALRELPALMDSYQ